jgi:hypothetical protein
MNCRRAPHAQLKRQGKLRASAPQRDYTAQQPGSGSTLVLNWEREIPGVRAVGACFRSKEQWDVPSCLTPKSASAPFSSQHRAFTISAVEYEELPLG